MNDRYFGILLAIAKFYFSIWMSLFFRSGVLPLSRCRMDSYTKSTILCVEKLFRRTKMTVMNVCLENFISFNQKEKTVIFTDILNISQCTFETKDSRNQLMSNVLKEFELFFCFWIDTIFISKKKMSIKFIKNPVLQFLFIFFLISDGQVETQIKPLLIHFYLKTW